LLWSLNILGILDLFQDPPPRPEPREEVVT
jgi:hypothetical protein